jgi:hypothetical protein
LLCKLQRGEEGQVCSWRDRAAGPEQGTRNLLERRQRRVAFERLRERRGARVPQPRYLRRGHVIGARNDQRHEVLVASPAGSEVYAQIAQTQQSA